MTMELILIYVTHLGLICVFIGHIANMNFIAMVMILEFDHDNLAT